MGENKGAQELGLFSIPIGDKKWFAEHTGHRRHHHHHHTSENPGEHKPKEPTPETKK